MAARVSTAVSMPTVVSSADGPGEFRSGVADGPGCGDIVMLLMIDSVLRSRKRK